MWQVHVYGCGRSGCGRYGCGMSGHNREGVFCVERLQKLCKKTVARKPFTDQSSTKSNNSSWYMYM